MWLSGFTFNDYYVIFNRPEKNLTRDAAGSYTIFIVKLVLWHETIVLECGCSVECFAVDTFIWLINTPVSESL